MRSFICDERFGRRTGCTGSNGGTGKWVRYDKDGRMIKGWQETPAGTYYFEEITGAMAKGKVKIKDKDEGKEKEYEFDIVTGILKQ